MKKLSLIFFLLFFSITVGAQQITLKGWVTDRSTSLPLIYTNVRIVGTSSGTTSNMEGAFELKLQPGNYTLTASYIGYMSDTISFNIQTNKNIRFELEPIPVHMAEITVFPGENPANAIIREAIETKHKRSNILNSYEFTGYTKGLVKTTKDFSTNRNSVDLSIDADTAKLKITGIIENVSKGYFKKPNYYKDEIIARKQSANTPASINIFTGGRIIQNFYDDDIQFIGRPLMSPIADDAIDYYYFTIVDTLAMDKDNVFQINVEPQKKSDPGFTGSIYIADNTFALVKLELSLNNAANPGGLFTDSKIIQQFSMFESLNNNSAQTIAMPIDYRIFADINYLGLVKLGFELNTIFHDYKINTPISDDVFSKAIVKVMSDADKKDSTYWKTTQTIPNSFEELAAYKRIDSLEAIPTTFWDRFSFLSSTININNNFSVTGPLGLYSFNRVEGHTLNYGANVYELNEKRLNSSIDFSYGFADKKFKAEFASKYFLGEYRTSAISVKAYDKTASLFEESLRYSKLTSTLTNLFGKYDFRHYYYTKGFEIELSSEVFPVLQLGIGFINRTDNNGIVNTDYSFFNRDKIYSSNKQIYETKVNAFTASFKFDFRNYIEDGFFRRRISEGKFFATLGGDVTLSNKNFLNSALDFQIYKLTLNGYWPNFRSAVMNFVLSGTYSDGSVPFQMLYALPGNIESASQTFTMRTLGTGEVFGDRSLILAIEQNFNDELFRLFGLTFLSDMHLMLYGHFNAALIEFSPKSFSILANIYNNGSVPEVTEYLHPFYELGFGVGHPLFPFKIEFTWKLNYFGKDNFVVGINSALF